MEFFKEDTHTIHEWLEEIGKDLEKETETQTDKYNFDFRNNRPISGRYLWNGVENQHVTYPNTAEQRESNGRRVFSLSKDK